MITLQLCVDCRICENDETTNIDRTHTKTRDSTSDNPSAVC